MVTHRPETMNRAKTKKHEDPLPLVMKLGPTTWKTLLALLGQRQPMGPRELARLLGLSSHTVALYHLNKLADHGLVEKTPDGDYVVSSEADLGFLADFLYVGFRAIPRNAFYAVFVTTLFVVYLLFVGVDYSAHSLFAVAIGFSATTFLWERVFDLWRRLPA
ncbi:MAG: helix-turn-helix domain-containing protein [Candidatus Thorarchaeota archaeon]